MSFKTKSNNRIRQKTSKRKNTIALMFLTIENHFHNDLWKQFLKGNQDKFRIYCHPKYPKMITQESFLHNKLINNLCHTQWGHLVCAYYNLLEEAFRDKSNVRFVYFSDSCIPIVNSNTAYNQLIAKLNKSFYSPEVDTHIIKQRYNSKSIFDGKLNAHRLRKLKIFKLIKHSAWFALNKTDAKALLSKKEAFQSLNHIPGGDEHILSLINYEKLEKKCITHVSWNYDLMKLWRNNKTKLWEDYDKETNLKKKQEKWNLIQQCRKANAHPREWTTSINIDDFSPSSCLFIRKIMPSCDVAPIYNLI